MLAMLSKVTKLLLVAVAAVCLFGVANYVLFRGSGANHCCMSWSRPRNELLTAANSDRFPHWYQFYRHTQGFKSKAGGNERTVLVVFLPGQSGSFEQIRSLASRIWRQALNDAVASHYYTAHFGEEFSALSPRVIERQCDYVEYHLRQAVERHETNGSNVSVLLVGHSMGALGALCVASRLSGDSALHRQSDDSQTADYCVAEIHVSGIVLLAAPIHDSVFALESGSQESWRQLFYDAQWFQNLFVANSRTDGKCANAPIPVVSVSAGERDHLMEPLLSLSLPHSVSRALKKAKRKDKYRPLVLVRYVMATTSPSVMRSLDHDAAVWCHCLVEAVAYHISEVLQNTQPLSATRNYAQLSVAKMRFPLDTPRFEPMNHVFSKKKEAQLTCVSEDLSTQSATVVVPLMRQCLLGKTGAVVLVCDSPMASLEICDASTGVCADYTKNLSGMHSTIAASLNRKNAWFDSFKTRIDDAFIPRFAAMFGLRDLTESVVNEQLPESLQLRIGKKGFDAKCSLWQGFPQRIARQNVGIGADSFWLRLEAPKKESADSDESVSQWQFITLPNLPSELAHELEVTISEFGSKSESVTGSDLCLSGASGNRIAAINGVYKLKRTKDGFYWTQHLPFWYTPYIAVASKKSTLKLFRMDAAKIIAETRRKQGGGEVKGEKNVRAMDGKWVIGTDTANIVAFCTSEMGESDSVFGALNCEEWAISESRTLRRRNHLQVSRCDSQQLSVFRVSLPSSKSGLYDAWFAMPPMTDSSVTHQLSIPRLTRLEMADDWYFALSLRLDFFLMDAQWKAMEVRIRHRPVVSLLKTSIHNWPSKLPRLFLKCVLNALAISCFLLFVWRNPFECVAATPWLIAAGGVPPVCYAWFNCLRFLHFTQMPLTIVLLKFGLEMADVIIVTALCYLFAALFSAVAYLWMYALSWCMSRVAVKFWVIWTLLLAVAFCLLLNAALMTPTMRSMKAMTVAITAVWLNHALLSRGWFIYIWRHGQKSEEKHSGIGLVESYGEQRLLDEMLLAFVIGTRFELWMSVATAHTQFELLLVCVLVCVDLSTTLLNADSVIHCGKLTSALVFCALTFCAAMCHRIPVTNIALLWFNFKAFVTIGLKCSQWLAQRRSAATKKTQ